MYVILCLFSALSRRVGTLQISIIIITNTKCLPLSNLFFQPMDPFFNFFIRGLSEQEKANNKTLTTQRPEKDKTERQNGMSMG